MQKLSALQEERRRSWLFNVADLSCQKHHIIPVLERLLPDSHSSQALRKSKEHWRKPANAQVWPVKRQHCQLRSRIPDFYYESSKNSLRNKLINLACRTLLTLLQSRAHSRQAEQLHGALLPICHTLCLAIRDCISTIYFGFCSSSCHLRAAARDLIVTINRGRACTVSGGAGSASS